MKKLMTISTLIRIRLLKNLFTQPQTYNPPNSSNRKKRRADGSLLFNQFRLLKIFRSLEQDLFPRTPPRLLQHPRPSCRTVTVHQKGVFLNQETRAAASAHPWSKSLTLNPSKNVSGALKFAGGSTTPAVPAHTSFATTVKAMTSTNTLSRKLKTKSKSTFYNT